MNIFNYIKMLPQAIAVVNEIRNGVRYVEDIFKGRAKGPVKKKMVIDTLLRSLELCRKLHITKENDLAPETVAGIVSGLIDTAVEIFNALGVFNHETEVTE